MKYLLLISTVCLLSFSSCEKCYTCDAPVGTDQQELCGRGGAISDNVSEAEAAGWTCVERAD